MNAKTRPRRTPAPTLPASAPGIDDMPHISDRQRQIYIEAARLFVDKGFSATSMSGIAEAVKITKAGLYHFVESKEDLLFTIMNYSLDRLHLDVIAPARAVEEPLERLKVIIHNHALNVGRVTLDSGSPLSIMVDDPQGLSLKNRKIIDERKRVYFDLLRDTLRALQSDGRLSPRADATVVAFSIIGMIMWIARWRRSDGKYSLEDVAGQVLRLTLSGVLARP
ncbi:TetR/AcrR family transcriptional regulator [Phenylobacterium sp.]|uniref:TetR/AcrR family transcriptional regulator n=1 Tax=Phenylobacterium sp. TaxID=1871053 RepID=UPI0025D0EB8F|nr:TetR/AcrR family transcriptional regulator [Phenylobacterium sp.]MBX3482973.1 TetR family transcriptional regulator [Phenylobacterium sp.]